MLTGWLQDANKNYYWMKASGEMVTGWRKIDDSWYYFDKEGHMVTGWQKIDDKYYFLDRTTGKMAADTTLTIDGKSYSFDKDGVYVEGSSAKASVSDNVPGTSQSAPDSSEAPGSGETEEEAPGAKVSSSASQSAPGSSSSDVPGGSSTPHVVAPGA